jgi:hypothetical protein
MCRFKGIRIVRRRDEIDWRCDTGVVGCDVTGHIIEIIGVIVGSGWDLVKTFVQRIIVICGCPQRVGGHNNLRERDYLLISGSPVFDVSKATCERKRNDETIRGDNTGFSPNFDGRVADKISKSRSQQLVG